MNGNSKSLIIHDGNISMFENKQTNKQTNDQKKRKNRQMTDSNREFQKVKKKSTTTTTTWIFFSISILLLIDLLFL